MKVYNQAQIGMMSKFDMAVSDVVFFTNLCDLLDDEGVEAILKDEAHHHAVMFWDMPHSMFYYRLKIMRKAGLIEHSFINIVLTDTGKACKVAIQEDKGLKFVHIAAQFYYSYKVSPDLLKMIKRSTEIRKNVFFLEVKTAQKMISERPIIRKYVRIY